MDHERCWAQYGEHRRCTWRGEQRRHGARSGLGRRRDAIGKRPRSSSAGTVVPVATLQRRCDLERPVSEANEGKAGRRCSEAPNCPRGCRSAADCPFIAAFARRVATRVPAPTKHASRRTALLEVTSVGPRWEFRAAHWVFECSRTGIADGRRIGATRHCALRCRRVWRLASHFGARRLPHDTFPGR